MSTLTVVIHPLSVALGVLGFQHQLTVSSTALMHAFSDPSERILQHGAADILVGTLVNANNQYFTGRVGRGCFTRGERMVDLKSGLPTEAKLSRVLAPTSRWCAGQGATQAGRARPEFGAEEGELDAVEERQGFKAGQSEQPFWPQDQLVSDMAIHLALMVEQLGLSASPNDWTQVRPSWHDCRSSVQPFWARPLAVSKDTHKTSLHAFIHALARDETP